MMCQKCNERPATVHFTKIIGAEKSGYHLCEQCAKEQGGFFAKAAHPFDFNQLLSGLLNMESSPGFTAPTPTSMRCDTCGMSYAQFTEMGRFGCPKCYDSFASRLDPLLRRIQNNTAHTGKVPVRTGEQVKFRKNMDRLRKELQQAIASEQFERAATLRDEIRTLEQQVGP
jgi:protein arginine kinase activator